MKQRFVMHALALLVLTGCAGVNPAPVPASDSQLPPMIVMAPMDHDDPPPQKCPAAAPNDHARAERWKAYAEKLEKQMNLSPETGIDP